MFCRSGRLLEKEIKCLFLRNNYVKSCKKIVSPHYLNVNSRNMFSMIMVQFLFLSWFFLITNCSVCESNQIGHNIIFNIVVKQLNVSNDSCRPLG